MASVVTINRADVVALIEDAANKFTGGNKTEAVALALKTLIDQDDRKKPLFGAHKGSVLWVDPTLDLTGPTWEGTLDAETLPWAANLGPEFDDKPKPKPRPTPKRTRRR